MWNKYTRGKQTRAELGETYHKSHVWIRARLDEYIGETSSDLTPQSIIVVPDITFWGRHYGVVVFRSWNLKRNIWWNEVTSETQAHYRYGRKILEEDGWTFSAAVVDGRRGLQSSHGFQRHPRTSVPISPNQNNYQVPHVPTENRGRAGTPSAHLYARQDKRTGLHKKTRRVGEEVARLLHAKNSSLWYETLVLHAQERMECLSLTQTESAKLVYISTVSRAQHSIMVGEI